MEKRWSEVDRYIAAKLIPDDPVFSQTLVANQRAGLPAQDVAPNQGKFLHIVALMIQARRILEIGTLGGYSTLWLARALPPSGRIVTLEANARHAEVARDNLRRAGVLDQVELRTGPALASLPTLTGPFDLIFIDADKPANPEYLAWAIKLSRPGTVIIGDNVVRAGELVNAHSEDERVQGVRRFFDRLGEDQRLISTALQTVGGKGWDGFSLTWVR
ncbi:O-methyltransferase [Sodalis praecaptivus]|uniref:O-methyltransferase n=1 Tax=Sodalis praecaptivus TaxID=1239307 RepID=W0HXR8_9GAMM|nr:O-methyltransferase [Sodalis praecaptivus]AHF78554.1 O-methyltransferase [Sodalis praecaptivus]